MDADITTINSDANFLDAHLIPDIILSNENEKAFFNAALVIEQPTMVIFTSKIKFQFDLKDI